DREYAIQVETPLGDCFAQEVVYEYVPHYCNNCHHIGHLPSKCSTMDMEPKGKKSHAQPVKQMTTQGKGVHMASKGHHQPSGNQAKQPKSPVHATKSAGDNEPTNKGGDQTLQNEINQENKQLSKAEGKRPMIISEPEVDQGLD
ncbi:Unknown protein, partial [Striga hermonthica]